MQLSSKVMSLQVKDFTRYAAWSNCQKMDGTNEDTKWYSLQQRAVPRIGEEEESQVCKFLEATSVALTTKQMFPVKFGQLIGWVMWFSGHSVVQTSSDLCVCTHQSVDRNFVLWLFSAGSSFSDSGVARSSLTGFSSASKQLSETLYALAEEL